MTTAFRREGSRDATLLNLATLARFHPRAGGPLFLRGGLGYSASILAGGGTLAEVSGYGMHAEVGAACSRGTERSRSRPPRPEGWSWTRPAARAPSIWASASPGGSP